jgi:putative sterol carrier protein
MPTVSEIFAQMPGRFRPDRAGGTNAVVQYDISGDGGGTWHAVIKDGTCTVNEGPGPNPNLTLQVAAQDWVDVTTGKQNPQMLFMAGKLKLKGDMGLAMKLGSMFAM